MARDQITAGPIVCGSCGAKIRARHRRCPRCRAVVSVPAAASIPSQATPSAPVRKWRWAGAAGLVVVAIGALGLPWLERAEQAARSRTSVRATDPLAARRPPPVAGDETEHLAPIADRSFMEPAAAAHAAYAGGDYETAFAQYKAAVERNPEDPDAWSNLGQVLVRLKRVEESIPCFTRALELVPDRWTYHFNMARAQGLLERWDEAIAGYRRARELFPDDYVTSFNLGLALHKGGDDAAAVDAYRKAIELAPADASFRLALGISYERLKKPAEAAAAYGEYLRLAPSAADADKVRGHVGALISQAAPPPGAAEGQAASKAPGG